MELKPGLDVESELEAAELESCKSAALIAGAAKILTDFVNGTSWGTLAAIGAAEDLLDDARSAHEYGREIRNSLSLASGRRPRATNKKKER